jgi:hypothetical protein
MKKLTILFCVAFALSLCAPAEDHLEVSAGYSHLTPDKDGFELSAGFLPVKHFVIEGEVGSYFRTNHNTQTYLFGPMASTALTHDGILTGFVRILFGGAHENNNYFAYLAGVGVDIGKHKIFVRPSADLIHYNDGFHARVGIGAVYRW